MTQLCSASVLVLQVVVFWMEAVLVRMGKLKLLTGNILARYCPRLQKNSFSLEK